MSIIWYLNRLGFGGIPRLLKPSRETDNYEDGEAPTEDKVSFVLPWATRPKCRNDING
jgi:hypothetical protein